MVSASSRRAGRVTNKSRLLVVRGSDKIDSAAAETVLLQPEAATAEPSKSHGVGAKGVETGELLVRVHSSRSPLSNEHACGGSCMAAMSSKRPSKTVATAWEPNPRTEGRCGAVHLRGCCVSAFAPVPLAPPSSIPPPAPPPPRSSRLVVVLRLLADIRFLASSSPSTRAPSRLATHSPMHAHSGWPPVLPP